MDNVVKIFILVTCVIGIAVGAVYLNKNINAGCVDFIFWKTCGVAITK